MNFASDISLHLSKSEVIALLEIADECLRTTSPKHFTEIVRKLSHLLPIEMANVNLADLNDDLSVCKLTRQVSYNFPDTWSKAYRAKSLMRIDPIARLLFRSSEPIFWSDIRDDCQDRESLRFYKLAADHGLYDGFSFGVRYPGSSRASFFTFSGKELKAPGKRERIIATYVMTHMHAALGRVYSARSDAAPRLTTPEAQALACVRRGKTTSEIAIQLNLSPRTVKFRVEQAMRKLQAHTRSEAVAQALIHRLIE